MTDLTRAMDSIATILQFQRPINASDARPDPFIATNWCVVEIDELVEKVAILSSAIKVARIHRNLSEARRLAAELRNTSYQLHEMAITASGVFAKAGT